MNLTPKKTTLANELDKLGKALQKELANKTEADAVKLGISYYKRALRIARELNNV